MGKKKVSKKKGKKKVKNRKTSEKWTKYELAGEGLKRAKYCPRCGPGVFLAGHDNRWTCGKCKYSEMK